jgi:hypothetical protein
LWLIGSCRYSVKHKAGRCKLYRRGTDHFVEQEFAGMKLPQRVNQENGCDVDRRGIRREYRYRFCGAKSRPGRDAAGDNQGTRR